ncbi:hypothetical protein APHAL10511_001568 [Amanita phalloides]|nr:hypothetical protein APHAL10511_001568 [Amanita phalloides]
MSIQDPFVLATYNSHLYASANPNNTSLAVQSDGVHVIELSTLRPVISYTLGPSTSFACSPLTVSDGHMYTIYAPIQMSSELVDEQEHGRTIWIWREDLNSSIADRAEAHKKKVAVTVSLVLSDLSLFERSPPTLPALQVPHTIAGLCYVPELLNRIIVLSPGGAITTLNSETLQVQGTWISQTDDAGRGLLKFFIYSTSECTFLPPRTTPQSGAVALLVLADPTTSDTRVEAVCIANEEKESPFFLIGSCRTDFAQNEILNVTCSSSGYLSIMTTNGEWHSFTVDSSEGDPIGLSQDADPFQLKNLQFPLDSRSQPVTLLPLTSSHVLLAGISSSSTEIIIHIWDLQYSVLLASHALPMPSAFMSPSSRTLSVALVPSLKSIPAKEKVTLIDSQALLVISASSTSTSKSKSKGKSKSNNTVATAVFVVPYVIPRASTVANALGRTSASTQWIAPRENDEINENMDGIIYSEIDEGRRKVLQVMGLAIEGKRPQTANDAFFSWEQSHRQAADRMFVYGHQFIKQVLDVVIQPTKDLASVMYSSEVVRHLIKRKVVNNSMVTGGLVRALKVKNDWTSIQMALENVVDVTESEIAEALWEIIIAHQERNPQVVEVDSVNDPIASQEVPSVTSFLKYCVNYRSTPAQLRLALRQQQLRTTPVPARECALAVLRLLIEWLNDDVALSPVEMKHDGNVTEKIPQLNKILLFTEVFLDATFLMLIQYPPAQEVLRQLLLMLEPEILFTEAIQPLYGTLDSFARAHKKAIREAEEKDAVQVSGAKGANTGSGHREDWRQRRKRAREQAGMSIGLYQLEELVL